MALSGPPTIRGAAMALGEIRPEHGNIRQRPEPDHPLPHQEASDPQTKQRQNSGEHGTNRAQPRFKDDPRCRSHSKHKQNKKGARQVGCSYKVVSLREVFTHPCNTVVESSVSILDVRATLSSNSHPDKLSLGAAPELIPSTQKKAGSHHGSKRNLTYFLD